MGTRDISMWRRGGTLRAQGSGLRVCGSCPEPRTQSPDRSSSGQIAISFLVLMAFTLMLVGYTIRLGQMSQVRAETSNAADAGALAAASWVASGQNEAAAVAEKMWRSIAMVQALYVVPFCPGADHTNYANALWRSLVRHPATGEDGPIAYFQDVADAAMVSGWVVGAREFFTAAVNNMMIRYNLGPEGVWGAFGGDEDLFGNLPQDIRNAQEDIYTRGAIAGDVTKSNPEWVTPPPDGAPPDALPKYKHHPRYRVEGYPPPPRLQMDKWSIRYWQYDDEELQTVVDDPGERFILSFKGKGVVSFWRNPLNPMNGPVVDLALAALPDDHNPLAVDPHGRKGWDIDLREIIPKHLAIGDCEDPVSGKPITGNRILHARQTAVQDDDEFIPIGIENGAGTLLVQVGHTVEQPSGEEVWGFPLWDDRFGPVASEAVAKITPATVTNPPALNADAQLTSTR